MAPGSMRRLVGTALLPAVVPLALLTACTSNDEAVSTTSSVSAVTSGDGPMGASNDDCADDQRFADDIEFAVALCEVDLAMAADPDIVVDGADRRARAVDLYRGDRDLALDLLFDLSDELAAETEE